MPVNLRSSGLFSIVVLSGGSAVGLVISALALILFSRVMGPVEFGLFSVAFAFMLIIVRLADFGTNLASERAISRVYADNPRQAEIYIKVALYLKAGSFLLVALLALALAPFLSRTVLHIESPSLIYLAIALALGTVIFEYTTLVFQGIGRFGAVARIMIAQGVAKLLFSLLLIWQGALSAFSGMLIYGAVPAFAALLAWTSSPVRDFSLPREWRRHLRHLASVAKWAGLSALAVTVSDNLDILLVQSYLTSYDTGLWSGTVRIAAFAGMVGYSIGSVLNVRVARYRRLADLKLYLGKAKQLSLLTLAATLISLPLAGLAIKLTIGPSYSPAAGILQILLLSAGIGAATAPFIALFYLFEKPQFYAWFGLLQILCLLVLGVIFIPLYGLSGAAWVRVVMRLFVLVFTLFYARRSYTQFVAHHGDKS